MPCSVHIRIDKFSGVQIQCVCTQPAAAAVHSARKVIRCIITVAAMKSTIMSVATVAVTKSVKPSVPFLPKKKTLTVARENSDGLMRLHKFLYIFNLRQGAILIAVQHIVSVFQIHTSRCIPFPTFLL